MDRKTFRLSYRAIWLAIPPALVMSLSSYLVGVHGYPFDHLALASVQDGHLEAAGRLRTFATWLLLAAAAIACTIYFILDTLRFPRSVKLGLFAVFAIFVFGGSLSIASGNVQGAQRIVDERVICAAFELIVQPRPAAGRAPDAGRPAEGQTKAPPSARLKSYGPPYPSVRDREAKCPANDSFRLLWWLNELQKYLMSLLIPALVLGTISCLALPPAPSAAACRYQVRRLNTHLYLTATSLVAGLLFISALLHWPAFAFDTPTAASYGAHVDAYVLFWGVTYTVLIASYYIPVAVLLSRACDVRAAPAPAAKKPGKESGADTPAGELFSLLKTVAALFAPAIAGLLGGILNL